MVNAQCNEIDQLTKMISTAANSTKLAKITHNNSTKAADYQAKAATAQTKLDSLNSNTTLTAACSSLASEKQAQKGKQF